MDDFNRPISNLIPDDPIIHQRGDLLGWDHRAKQIAEQILSISASNGLVVGLTGPWGSGKTSMLNLMEPHLKVRSGTKVIRFNPWMVSTTPGLVSMFFAEIAHGIRGTGSKALSKVGNKLQAYGDLVSLLQLLPDAGVFAVGATAVVKGINATRTSAIEDLFTIRDDLTRELKGITESVVVIVDDLDRLDTDEVREVFRLVRLTASFPNLIYVVSFDGKRVAKALEADNFDGTSYVEKIVQVNFEMPMIPERTLRKLTTDHLDSALENHVQFSDFQTERWSVLLDYVIMPLVRNIRDVKRLSLSVRASAVPLGQEVNAADLVTLETLRLLRPDLFALVARYPDAFVRQKPPLWEEHLEGEYKRIVTEFKDLGGIASQLENTVINNLFPMAARHVKAFDSSALVKNWYTEKRVAHELYLNLYLERWESPEFQASREARKALTLVSDPYEFKTFVNNLGTEKWGLLVEAMEFVEDQVPEGSTVGVVGTLLNLVSRIKERQKGLFERTDVDNVFAFCVRRIGACEESKQGVIAREVLDEVHDVAVQREFAERLRLAKSANGKNYIEGIEWETTPWKELTEGVDAST